MTTYSKDSSLKWQASETNEDQQFAYPRRQLRRKRWICLNGEWDFLFDSEEAYTHPQQIKEWQHKINVPFAPETALSGIGDQAFHPRCWYQRKVFFERPEGKRLMIHFGAVDYIARVWVNNQFVGKHQGGYTPFSFDVSDYVTESGEQVITVLAEDDPHDLAKPRGKQDWQLNPHSIWYPRTTGIWQTVWLEEVPKVFIDRIVWTPHLERYEIGCELFVSGNTTQDVSVRVKLVSNGRLLAEDFYKVINHEVHRRIALSDPGIDDYRNELLWSPERPNLIDAFIELWVDGKIVDQIESYTALRSVGVLRDRFMLNGRPYYLRLVLDQGFWTESLMTAPNSQAFKKDVELVKAAGFNGVRKHQKIEDPEFLYWADVLGIVVWGEMPSAYRFTHTSVERLMKEWIQVIDRDINHPSLVVWVPFNESWGVPDLTEKENHRNCVQAMYHLTRTLDSSRPVVGNDGWESTATDILGVHDYDANPAHILEKYDEAHGLDDILHRRRPGGRVLTLEGHPHEGQPVMLTEFGGIACIDEKTQAKQKIPEWGYSVCSSSAELEKRYHALLDAVHQVEFFSGFCYTQFTDTFQEANGIFHADRTPKFPIKSIARATKGNHFHHDLTLPPSPPMLIEDRNEPFQNI